VGDNGEGRAFRENLTVVVVIGALWRVVRLAISKWNLGLQLNDSLYYSLQARQLAHGVWFREPFANQPGAEHGPLTSTLMAFVSWGDDPINRQRLVTVACGTATIAVIGLVARRAAGDRAGLVAAGLAAVYPNLWINDGLVMSESVSCLMISLSLLAVVTWAEHPTLRVAMWIGVATGLGALARSEMILFVPVAAVVMWVVAARSDVRPLGHVSLVVGVALVVILPWTVFNAARFDRPVLLSTNDGSTLMGSNCDATYYGPLQGSWSLLCVVNDPGTKPGEDPSERSARRRHEAVVYARDHVRRVPTVVAKRIGRSLDLFAVRSMVHGDAGEERERWASWACVVSFWIMAPLAVVGALHTRRRHLAFLLIPIGIALTATVLLYGGHRMRSAAEPSIVILAAVAVARWSTNVWRSQPSASPS